MTSAATTSVTPIAPRLGGLSDISAEASRLFHDRRMLALWQWLASEPVQVIGAKGPRRAPIYLLKLDCDAGAFSLALQSGSHDTVLAMAAADDLGEALSALAIEALFGEMIQRLEGQFLPGLHPVSLSPLPAAAAPRAGWCSVRNSEAGVEIARLAFDMLPSGIAPALRVASKPMASPSSLRNAMHMTGSVALASRPMAIELLRSLKKGDVVILPMLDDTLEDSQATLRLGPRGGRRLTATGRIQDDSLVVEGELQMLDDEQEPLSEYGAEAESLGELELPVRFEIETASIPLAELEAIEPGYVIELAMPAADARLRLVSCGHVIGHAELVSVGGRLGARITRMVAQDESSDVQQ